MQRPHYSFRASDMGALSDTSGNPAHITAEREYRASDPLDWPVIDYRESDLARLGPVETKSHQAGMPGRQKPRMFAEGKWADRAARIALAVSVAAVAVILIFEHFKGIA